MLVRPQQTVTMENILDGRRINFETQLQLFTLDFVVLHVRVFTGNAANEGVDVWVEPWSRSVIRMLTRPLPAHEFPMSFQDSFRLD